MALQKFKLPPSASRWKRKFYYFLRNKLKLPGESSLIFSTHHLQFPRTYETIVYWSVVVWWSSRYHSYGTFLFKSKDVGYYHLVVYLGAYCTSVGPGPYICKSSSSSMFGFLKMSPVFAMPYCHWLCVHGTSCIHRYCRLYNLSWLLLTSCFCFTSFDGVLRYYEFQILGTGFSIILLNLGKRQPGDVRYVHF